MGRGERNCLSNGYSFGIINNSFCKENIYNEAHDLLMQRKDSNIYKYIYLCILSHSCTIRGFCKVGVHKAHCVVMKMDEGKGLHSK